MLINTCIHVESVGIDIFFLLITFRPLNLSLFAVGFRFRIFHIFGLKRSFFTSRLTKSPVTKN